MRYLSLRSITAILKNLVIEPSTTKKHKGVRRDTKGMNFECYTERIATLKEPDAETNKKQIVDKRLQLTNTEMKITGQNKVQFTTLNGKRYYFSDGIVSLSYGHPLLSKI